MVNKTLILLMMCLVALPSIYSVDATVIIHIPNVFAHVENVQYNTTHNMSFSRLYANTNHLLLNQSKFYINSPNYLNITMDFISSNIFAAGFGDRVMAFYGNTISGNVYFNISGFLVGITYQIDKNGINLSSFEANASGYISFNNSIWGDSNYFEISRKVPANPAQITVTVTDRVITTICAEISITNEGAGNQEYIYYYWITPRANGEIVDGDTVDSGSASKMIAPSDTFIVEKCLTLPNGGTYWFKVKVFWDADSSSASEQFIAIIIPGAPEDGGGGGRGIPLVYSLIVICEDTSGNRLNDVLLQVYEMGRFLGSEITDISGETLFKIPKRATITIHASKHGYDSVDKTVTVDNDMTITIQMHPTGIPFILWILLLPISIIGSYVIYKKHNHKK